MTNGISIIICTHNGRKFVADVLHSIAANKVECPVEVILVDNASTDGVAQEAVRQWTDLNRPFPLKVLIDTRLGKSFAFFTGVSEAKCEIVVMCDDDNLLARDYFATAIRMMRDPSIGALGGSGVLKANGSPPAHFYNFAPWFAVGAQIRTPGEAELDSFDITAAYPDMVLWGAGLVMRRSDLLQLMEVEGFPVLEGQCKCEDSELCHAIALMGRRLVYTRSLRFEHVISLERLEPSRIQRRFDYDQIAEHVLVCYKQLRRNGSETAWKTVTRFPWRALRASLTSNPVRPWVFGVLARARLTFLMTSVEKRIYVVNVQLTAKRKVAGITSESGF